MLKQVSSCLLLLSVNNTFAQFTIPCPPQIIGNSSKNNSTQTLELKINSNIKNIENKKEYTIYNGLSIDETIWDGKTWSNGYPNYSKKLILNADLETTEVIEAFEVEISDGVKLILNSGALLKIKVELSESIKKKIIFNENSGIIFKTIDDGNPLTPPLPPVTITRINNVNQYSDILMSSPVDIQNIGGTNPSTAYSQHKFDNNWVSIPVSETMMPGRGYSETINGNGIYDGIAAPPTGATYEQSYTGTINTGTYSFPSNGLQLVGNPYANYLDADTFLQDSSNSGLSGSIYLWTHNTVASVYGNGGGIYSFTTNDYAIYNLLGGVSAGRDISNQIPVPSYQLNLNIPDGKIAFGTGFFVVGSATFKPDMATSSGGNQIFRTNTVENTTTLIPPPVRHRIWINLAQGSSSTPTRYRQALIGYATGATNTTSNDKFDTPTVSPGTPLIDVYSLRPSSTENLAIQGRDFSTFSGNDVIQLGCQVVTAGTYTFSSIGDGMFATGGTKYYIRDNANNSINNLPYTTTINAGTDNTRFQIVFDPVFLTQVQSSQCGVTLPAINSIIYANNISVAQLYRWKITRLSDGYEAVKETALRSIYLSNYPDIRMYNETYAIQVAVKVNGIWYPYSISCNVSTPGITTQLTTCNGLSISSHGTQIYANDVLYVPGYRWEITNMTTSESRNFGTILRTFNFSNTALLSPTGFMMPNTQYCVTVRPLNCNSVDNLQNGNTCCLWTTSNYSKIAENNFKNNIEVIVAPNPFENAFEIAINTPTKENVSIRIYDLLGKLVESFDIAYSELNNLKIGQNYLSGFYQVKISQGEFFYSSRLIKK